MPDRGVLVWMSMVWVVKSLADYALGSQAKHFLNGKAVKMQDSSKGQEKIASFQDEVLYDSYS